jgi:hypothetical protein
VTGWNVDWREPWGHDVAVEGAMTQRMSPLREILTEERETSGIEAMGYMSASYHGQPKHLQWEWTMYLSKSVRCPMQYPHYHVLKRTVRRWDGLE